MKEFEEKLRLIQAEMRRLQEAYGLLADHEATLKVVIEKMQVRPVFEKVEPKSTPEPTPEPEEKTYGAEEEALWSEITKKKRGRPRKVDAE